MTQREASDLCTAILKEAPGYVPALVWATERGFDFDAGPSILALQRRLQTKDKDPDEVIALFGLLASGGDLAQAEAVLDSNREMFEAENKMFIWRAHKAQLLVSLGNDTIALDLANQEQDTFTRRQVRRSVTEAMARKTGDRQTLANDLEADFAETGDGEILMSCCLAERTTGNWTFIADHAERLIKLVGTDAALRVSVEGAVNSKRPQLALQLLERHVGLCPGVVLPPDLHRAKAEALRQLGKVSEAVEAAERAAKESPDLATLAQLFRLKQFKGDLVGSAATASQLLPMTDVPPQFLTEEVVPAIRRVAPELGRNLVLKAKEALPEDSPALILVAQQASKLGLADVAKEIFGKLPLWAEKGVKGIEALNVDGISEIMRQELHYLLLCLLGEVKFDSKRRARLAKRPPQFISFALSHGIWGRLSAGGGYSGLVLLAKSAEAERLLPVFEKSTEFNETVRWFRVRVSSVGGRVYYLVPASEISKFIREIRLLAEIQFG